ncbi:MAG: hypothetical protein ABEI96_06220 [Haloarculaceae archaeon]
MSDTAPLRCQSCGREAVAGADEWDSVTHPSLGTLTQCPDCGSTDVQRRR